MFDTDEFNKKIKHQKLFLDRLSNEFSDKNSDWNKFKCMMLESEGKPVECKKNPGVRADKVLIPTTKNSKDIKTLLFVICLMVALFGVFGFGGYHLCKKLIHNVSSEVKYHVVIESGENSPQGCKSDSAKECLITYKTEDGSIDKIQLSNAMWDHLKQERAETDNIWGPLFFDFEAIDRIIDVTLDVSRSVITHNKNNGSYSETQFAKLKEYLLSKELNMRPGDIIRVRYLGQDEKKRAKAGLPDHLEIKFWGPQFEYSKKYSEHLKTVYISIKNNKFNPDTAVIDSEGKKDVYHKAKVIDLVSDYYKLAINNEISSSKTYIIENAIRTFDENQMHKFNAAVYILLTDGEFDVESDYIKKFGWSEYFSSNYFNFCSSIAEHFKNGDIKGKGDMPINLNQNNNSSLVLIGFINGNNNDYANAGYDVFRSIYSIKDNDHIKFVP